VSGDRPEITPVAIVDDQLSQVKYNSEGLVPVIAQDLTTKQVLMMAWMNAEWSIGVAVVRSYGAKVTPAEIVSLFARRITTATATRCCSLLNKKEQARVIQVSSRVSIALLVITLDISSDHDQAFV